MNPSNPSSSSSQHVRVAVHVRPLLPGETGDLDSVSIEGGKKVLFGAAAAGGTSTNGSASEQQQHRSAVAFDLAAGLSAGGVDPALLYETCVSPLVDALFEGFNASVLAYGPTGSGKTFTMGTDFSGHGGGGGGGFSSGDGDGDAAAAAMMPGGGIVPRVAKDLFSRVERALKEGKEGGGSFAVDACSVRLGFVEVYAEEVRDLLSSARPPSSDSPTTSAAAAAPFSTSSEAAAPTLTLRDSDGSSKGGSSQSPLASSGAAEVEVSTAEELTRLLSSAGRRRATGATAVNAASSRSHAIVTLTVEQRGRRRGTGGTKHGAGEGAAPAPPGPPETATVSAKMCLVDLAGSERQKRTLASGMRLKEATAINRGLLALGNVIGALAAQSKAAATAAAAAGAASAAGASSNPPLQQQAQQQQQHRHIPYRDSKLTRLLADALGGASRTLLVACVSRADADADEAAATLRYAARARAIVNVPRANVFSSAAAAASCCAVGSLCAANAAELEALRMELVGARGRIAALERELSESRKKKEREKAAVFVPGAAAAAEQFSVRPSSETAARYAAEAAAARRRAAALRAAAAAATADGGGGAGATEAAAVETTAKIVPPASSRPPLPPHPAPGPLAAGAALRAGVGRKQGAATATVATTMKPQPLSLPPSPSASASSSSFAKRFALSSLDGNSPERKQPPPQSSSRWW